MERETGFEPATLSLGSSENKLILLDLGGHFSRFSDQFSKRAPYGSFAADSLENIMRPDLAPGECGVAPSQKCPRFRGKVKFSGKRSPTRRPREMVVNRSQLGFHLSHDLVMIGCQAIASGQTVPGSRPREHATRQTGLHCKPNETSAHGFSGGTIDWDYKLWTRGHLELKRSTNTTLFVTLFSGYYPFSATSLQVHAPNSRLGPQP
jgi:hypothetical protein